MRPKSAFGLALLAMLLRAAPGHAQLLDTLLPPAIPGYGQAFSVIAQHRQSAPGATGWTLGTLSAAPSLNLAGGYDSAPGGSAGSPLLRANPSLLLTDPIAGFGLYGQAALSAYPANHAQNTQTALLGAGERIVLPRETITLSAAYLHGAVTGFAFDTTEITAPVPFNMQDLRASDKIAAGLFTLTPEFSLTRFSFSGASAIANRTQPQGTLTLAYVPAARSPRPCALPPPSLITIFQARMRVFTKYSAGWNTSGTGSGPFRSWPAPPAANRAPAPALPPLCWRRVPIGCRRCSTRFR